MHESLINLAELKNEEQRYFSQVAYVILLTALFASVAIAIAGLVGGFPYYISSGVAVFSISLFILWLTRRGHLLPARLILPFVAYVLATYLVVANEGLHDEGMFIYPLTLVFAGLLLGKRSVVVYTVLVLGAIAAIGNAEMNGLLVNRFSAFTNQARLTTVDTLLGFTGILLYVTIDSLERSLTSARRTQAELATRVEELAALDRITQAIATTLDFQSVLDTVARMMPPLFNAQGAIIGLLDPATLKLVVQAHHSFHQVMPNPVGTILDLPGDPGLARVIESSQPCAIDEPNSTIAAFVRQIMPGQTFQYLLSIPLRKYSESIGIIIMPVDQTHRAMTPAEVELAETIAGQVTEAIENAHLFEQEQKAKQAADQARQAAEQARHTAEAASRAKSVFLANMSHEFRTPLNAILGFTRVMAPAANLTAEQRENLQTVERSGEHLLALVNRALSLTQSEAGGERLRPEDFDLQRLGGQLEAQQSDAARVEPELELAGMPGEWLSRLHHATIEGDLELMVRLAEQIQEEHPALAGHLTELISNFEHKRILKMIDSAESLTPESKE